MRLTVFLCLACFLHLSAETAAQIEKVSIDLQNVPVSQALRLLGKELKKDFFYSDVQINMESRVTLKLRDATIDEALKKIFPGKEVQYEVQEDYILILEIGNLAQQQAFIVIRGVVKDEQNNPLPGATIIQKGTRLGTVTNKEGRFQFQIPHQDTLTLVVSFIGMEKQEVKLERLKPGESRDAVNIIMKAAMEALEGVVVTGYANIRKSSFTGSATLVKREDILKVSSGNLIDALQVFDPSLQVRKNNEMGSDPNTLPEFYVRGRSGIASVKELDLQESTSVSEFALVTNPNLPVFILDGFEVGVEKIYDFDINRIKDITILKDAAATAIYGSRASNGVIVIETVAPRPGELLISYSGNLAITAPDLSSYNLMNAEEKLEAEVAAGIFEPWGLTGVKLEYETTSLIEYYLQKRNRVLIGVDNYWLSQPLRTEFNHKHSLYIEGGAEHIRFGIELRYDNEKGVMKKSYRDRMGAGLTLDYRYKGWQIKNVISYDIVKAKDSPYGSFRDYTTQQPYSYWEDPDTGELIKTTTQWGNYGGSLENPLYEAATGNFSKSDYTELTNNLSLIWRANSYFQIKGQLAISTKDANTTNFTDPASGTYGRVDLFTKGELVLTETLTNRWNSNLFGTYNRTFLDLHNINMSAGINATSANSGYLYTHYRGFPDKDRNSPAYAYEIVSKPAFSDNKTRLFGGFVTLNYSYNNIYLLDASYRFDGSSEFGSEKKWAPFWSAGTGVNLHNYAFLKSQDFLTLLKLKANIGETGKSNFKPYMAQNTFRIMLDNWYPTGIGAELIYMGNNSLTWEKQLSWNIGMEIGIWRGRANIEFDVYNKRTRNLVTDVSLPSSSGFPTYTDNMGEVENKGFEVDVNLRLITGKNWDVAVFGNMAHNKNKILKISESLKEYNERVDEYYADYSVHSNPQLVLGFGYTSTIKYASPIMKYEEGSSLTTIYGMKSLGINPANGQEIYVKRDGSITYDWSSLEQQPIGDEEPWGHGAFGFNVRFKNFTLYTTFLYEFGGDTYNTTLITNVENANLNLYNVDKRAWTDRWQKVGDVTPLKSIKDRYYVTRPTSRFVQRNNYVTFNSLSLGYNVDSRLLNRIGVSTLRCQFNMKDIATMSTVKKEMGLTYPFARTFTFTLNASF